MIGKGSVNEISYHLNQMESHSNISVKRLVLHFIGGICATILLTLLLLSKFFDFQSSGNPLYLIYVSLGVFIILMFISILTPLKRMIPFILLLFTVLSGTILLYISIILPQYISDFGFLCGIAIFLVYLAIFCSLIYLHIS
jgi:hypothetical protein